MRLNFINQVPFQAQPLGFDQAQLSRKNYYFLITSLSDDHGKIKCKNRRYRSRIRQPQGKGCAWTASAPLQQGSPGGGGRQPFLPGSGV